MTIATSPRTLFQKLWEAHLVGSSDGRAQIYIDRHLVHEVSSPQAFEGLRDAGRPLWRRRSILAVPDHNVPTTDRANGVSEGLSKVQLDTLSNNAGANGLRYFPLTDVRQGIVHVVGPEQGFTLPGLTVVCGDSHTTTHGALGCLAFGIGTSEVEHVMATQTVFMPVPKTMRVTFRGKLARGVSAKDMALFFIGQVGTSGATGHVIEFDGEAVTALSIEGRMTLCNMSIEAGARAALIAVDDETITYVKDRPLAPKGAMWEEAVAQWRDLVSDAGALFDSVVSIDAGAIAPQVTWGTSPDMVGAVSDLVPDPQTIGDPTRRSSVAHALAYMGLQPNTKLDEIQIDHVFIGSCTNSRIEDLRAAAQILKGRKVSDRVRQALVVPGSGLVAQQAIREGLDRVFVEAGFQWRAPGCSMCLGMNGDEIGSEERCASTSNRNFEGRQGDRGRTHLVSPQMAAAAAIAGTFVDIREGWLPT
ncbi:3-isopropylmalate dehydratase large subunit [Variovorax boronicumulans]|uniref:3-isopropylmalate dehydratase large subunit n=1 Tax=Variovorax boronicumulans TaxID=436515 RepID=UPI00339174DA